MQRLTHRTDREASHLKPTSAEPELQASPEAHTQPVFYPTRIRFIANIGNLHQGAPERSRLQEGDGHVKPKKIQSMRIFLQDCIKEFLEFWHQ